jgi:hypothetical protein
MGEGWAMDMLNPDLMVQVSGRRWSCVLDPALALSRYGVPLACGLGRVMEVWMVPEFWHILDNTFFYLNRPELLLPSGDDQSRGGTQSSEETTRALRQWEKLRDETDFVRQSLNWVGDAPRESSMPEGTSLDLVIRWERLAQALDSRAATRSWSDEALHAASRDAAALSVALPAASILTLIDASVQEDARPAICGMLDRFGLECRPMAPLNEIAVLEREIYRQLLVRAGLTKYLWAGLVPSVLHLVAPAAAVIPGCIDPAAADDDPIDDAVIEPPREDRRLEGNPWDDAHGLWYSL